MNKTILVLAILLISFVGCGSEEISRPIVSGYDEFGSYQVTEGLLKSEACPAIGSLFTDLCLDSNAQSIKTKGCANLCSVNVVAGGS